MKLKEIISEKLDRLETIPDALATSVEKAQKVVLKEVLELISELDYKGTALNPSVQNLAKIESIINKIQEVLFKGEYLKAVREFAAEFPKQAKITEDYFKSVFGSLTDESIFQVYVKTAQKNAVSLLADTAIDANFLEPIRQQLAQSITSGSSFADTVKALTNAITGDENEGKLLRYVKTVSRDSFAIADRTYTKLVADSIGAEWWHYVGGLIKDSREFCRERNNQYYHIKEIESWAKLQWQGKNKSVTASTMIQFLGGHGCLHSALPVSEFVVPQEVINRNIKSGNYTPKKKKAVEK